MSRFAFVALILSTLLLVGTAIRNEQQLPQKIATHFDGNGHPNGWSSKSSFTTATIAIGLSVPAFVMGILYSIRFFPARFLNVPNSTYWREPKNFRKACDFLFMSSLWFGCAFILWQVFLSRLIVTANQASPPQLRSETVVGATIVLLAFTFSWLAAIVVRFLKATDNELPPRDDPAGGRTSR